MKGTLNLYVDRQGRERQNALDFFRRVFIRIAWLPGLTTLLLLNFRRHIDFVKPLGLHVHHIDLGAVRDLGYLLEKRWDVPFRKKVSGKNFLFLLELFQRRLNPGDLRLQMIQIFGGALPLFECFQIKLTTSSCYDGRQGRR